MRQRRVGRTVSTAGILLVLTICFWWFRILRSGTIRDISFFVSDLYVEYLPTIAYAFETLKAGSIPLWNPYQFCGSPFLAQGWTGIFYPPRLVMLFFDVFPSLEALLVFHLFLGAVGMWALARQLGLGTLGGLCAAMTFVWSRWLITHHSLPAIFEAITWMPTIVLMADRVMLGKRFAWLGLVVTLTCQLLVGMLEIVLHTAYLVALFVVCRLVQLGRQGLVGAALRRVGVAAASAAAALLLSMPNTLPLIELVQQSARSTGALSFAQVVVMGTIQPYDFLRDALAPGSLVTVGVLPLVAFPLAWALRRNRMLWIGCVVAAVGAMLLIFGGLVFRIYYEIPVVGALFRRPMKFLDIYVFAQALLAGAAVTRLGEWSAAPRRDLWRHPGWLSALVLGVAMVACMAWLQIDIRFAGVMVAALLLFGAVPVRAARSAIVVGLCLLQGASLFFTVANTHVRPVVRPEIYRRHDRLLDQTTAALGHDRIYLSRSFWFEPSLTPRQGTMRKMAVVNDYEPLATARYATFFDAVSGIKERPWEPFAGYYDLSEGSRWRLMDLTSTRYFVMQAGEPGAKFMARSTRQFQLVMSRGSVRVFRQSSVLPRAYLVPRARVLPGPDEVLAALDTPDFDPRREVLLEEMPAGGLPAVEEPSTPGEVTIASYEPERVVLSARLTEPGFLVLGDAFYPGWKATVGAHEVPIYRGNYLFRVVRLDAGTSEIRFDYRPRSFQVGSTLFGATTLVVLGTALVGLRRRRLD